MDSDSDDGLFTLPKFDRAPRRHHYDAHEPDPCHLLSDDSHVERLLNDCWDDETISEESVDLGYLDGLRGQRPSRKATAYPYSGDLTMAVNKQFDNNSKKWRSLPPTELERRWVAEFWMPEEVFEELLALVEPHMEQ
jgi:hypothetical protein